MINTDRATLTQIIFNLTRNAINFTSRGSVRLKLRSTIVDGIKTTEISIVDTGIGIREEDRSKIFQAINQPTRSPQSIYAGAGLGLQLSQGLAQLLGACITFESEYGKGSTFKLTISEKWVRTEF